MAYVFNANIEVTADISTDNLNPLNNANIVVTSELDLSNNKITSLATPTNNTDGATKAYVDSVAQGLDVKDSVVVATTVAGTLTTSFENGDTIDGIVLVTSDRILIKDQTSGVENGIYTVNATGAPTRSVDASSGSSMAGAFMFVEEGTVNADAGFVCTNNSGSDVVGTDALVFTQFSGAGAIIAGAGLTKTGNTLDVGAGTGMVINANDIATNANQSHVTTVGALNSGSITSGFGNIDIGTSAITGGQITIDQININAGLISYTGTTGNNQIVIPDNLADGFSIQESTNKYITIVTTNGSEAVSIPRLIDNPDGVRFVERVAVPIGNVAGFGQIWVRNSTPNVLIFTDDAGTDTVLGATGATPTLSSVLTAGADTGATSINFQTGSGMTSDTGVTAVGVPISITAGNGDSGFAGGLISVTAGNGATTGSGGAITLLGGTGGTTTTPTGGAISITGGTGGTGGVGGNITIQGGTGEGAGTGGNNTIIGGTGGATGVGGTTILQGGAGGATSGSGGAVTISGGVPATSGDGGVINISGANGVGTNQNGGNVSVTAGDATGVGTSGTLALMSNNTGTAGDITFQARGSAVIEFNQSGNVDLSSGFTATSIIGALNELKNVGKVIYNMINLEVNIIDSTTSETSIAYITWDNSRMTNYPNGTLVFTAIGGSTQNFTVTVSTQPLGGGVFTDISGGGQVVASASVGAVYNLSITNPSSDLRIAITVTRAGTGGTNGVIVGATLEF